MSSTNSDDGGAYTHAPLNMQMRYRSVVICKDTSCYFKVRSKADMSQLNLPHGNNGKTEKN